MRYLFFIALFLLPATSFAAEFRFEQQTSSVRVGDTFIVNLLLYTETDVINAIEGSVHFPPSLSLSDIRLRGSLVPLWISSPMEKEKGTVSFAGILPGGYQGTGNVFTLLFKATQKGTARISYGADTKAYQNDGKGTAATLSMPALSLSISPSSGTPADRTLEKDSLPPEPFTPEIIPGEPFGFEDPVLIFTAQDKDSGIARYDIARSYYRNAKEENLFWHEAHVPYAFVEGDSARYLYVRAVDRAGNTRIAKVQPQEFSVIVFALTYWYWILLLVFLVILPTRFYKR